MKPALPTIDEEIEEGVTGDNAKLDVRGKGFWRDGQNTYFNFSITNANAPPQRHLSTERIFINIKTR